MAATSNDANTMPPPPVPAFSKSAGAKFLQPEFEALAQCLKDAIVKTGQIYGFYSEAQKLGIMDHIPNPPRKLTAALGRDIERYDQICDSIEAQLHRAISVLKRDLRREEQKKEEEERRNVANIQPMIEDTTQPPDAETTLPKSSTATLLARRPSAVSISSLQRPHFPLKLDLSSASLRITEEEAAMFQKDIGSPVTLAPKSARLGPNEFPSDLMIAFSNTPIQPDLVRGPPTMDLTMSDSTHMTEEPSGLPLQLGNTTADKAIELDLDMDIDMANMTDLFGDSTDSENATNAVDRLFIPGEGSQAGEPGNLPSKGNVLSGFEIDADVDAELFGEFNPDTGLEQRDTVNNTTGVQSTSSVPSPGSLLAQFSASDLENGKVPLSTDHSLSTVSGEGFDMTSIDLSKLDSGFFPAGQNSEMDFRVDMEFMGIDTSGDTKTE